LDSTLAAICWRLSPFSQEQKGGKDNSINVYNSHACEACKYSLPYLQAEIIFKNGYGNIVCPKIVAISCLQNEDDRKESCYAKEKSYPYNSDNYTGSDTHFE